MNVQSMYNTAIRRTYTTQNNYPLDADSMIDANYIYQDFCGEIMKLNENYFYDRFFFDTTAYINRYPFDGVGTNPPIATDIVKSMKKILWVSMKYNQSRFDDFTPNFQYYANDKILRSTDWLTYVAVKDFMSGVSFVSSDRQQIYVDYIEVRESSFNAQEIESYNINMLDVFSNYFDLPMWVDPIYIFGQDREQNTNRFQNALYIYPYSKQSIKQWLKIEGIASIIDLQSNFTENQVQIEREYHNILVEWRMWLIYQSQWKIAEANQQQQRYIIMRSEALSQITDRTQSPNYVSTPNLIYLQ